MAIRRKNWTILALVLTSLLLMLTGCGSRTEAPQPPSGEANTSGSQTDSSAQNPVATIEMENGKTITVELYPKVAPNTVNNFIHLADRGFYDGTIFHRVIKGFMVQGGDPKGSGTGGPGYDIRGEFTNNGFKNDLKHTRGVLSMARTESPDTGGSQFFYRGSGFPSS